MLPRRTTGLRPTANGQWPQGQRRLREPHGTSLRRCHLHADDDPDILAQAGFEVVGEAETGAQAVEKYKELKPDLVTMDIVMPDMGGIDAVREI